MATNIIVRECAEFIEDELDAATEDQDADVLQALITESALAAGFSSAQIAAAWDLVDYREGA